MRIFQIHCSFATALVHPLEMNEFAQIAISMIFLIPEQVSLKT